jgi:hypothetical protein
MLSLQYFTLNFPFLQRKELNLTQDITNKAGKKKVVSEIE